MFIQAGGHQLIKVVDDGKCIVKPTKNNELKFYQKKLQGLCPELKAFIPKFFDGGRIENIKDLFSEEEYEIITKKSYKRYIKIENLLNTSQDEFCIIDIKLGKFHWKSCASDDNIKECQKRNAGSIMNEYGIRLDGFVKKENDSLVRFSKEECRVMSIEKVKEILAVLTMEEKHFISKWILDLQATIQHCNVNMYGPSVLILKSESGINVKLIDFTTHEKCVINKQFEFSKNNDAPDKNTRKQQKKEEKRMRKFLVRYNKLDLLKTMHDDILYSLESLFKLLN